MNLPHENLPVHLGGNCHRLPKRNPTKGEIQLTTCQFIREIGDVILVSNSLKSFGFLYLIPSAVHVSYLSASILFIFEGMM